MKKLIVAILLAAGIAGASAVVGSIVTEKTAQACGVGSGC